MPSKKEIREFSEKIEFICETKYLTTIEAIVFHCNETGLEVEMAAKMLSSNLKHRLTSEAEALNLIKTSGGRIKL